jgi:hypothetical protein
MPFCGYILYLSDGSPSQQKNQSKSKIKKVNQKLFPATKTTKSLLLLSHVMAFSSVMVLHPATTTLLPVLFLLRSYIVSFFFLLFNFPLNHV